MLALLSNNYKQKTSSQNLYFHHDSYYLHNNCHVRHILLFPQKM